MGDATLAPAVSHAASTKAPLLGRVRGLFLALAVTMLAVELIELLDASTPLWPQRIAAAVGLLGAAGLLLAVRAEGWRPGRDDVVAVLSVLTVGWGMGRVGAVLALLLGLGILRALYGTRRSTGWAIGVFIVAYAGVGVLLEGPGALLDLNLLVVGGGLGAFATVVRQVAEVVAEHDVAATWDRVLAGAAGRLLHVTTGQDIDDELAAAVRELDGVTTAAAGGLVEVPVASDLDPGAEPPASDLGARLHARLQRLWTDARLARSLQVSEERYRRLAEGSRDGIYLRSAATVTAFPYVNAAGRAMLGEIDRPGAPGIDLGRVHTEDRSVLVDALKTSDHIAEPVRVRLVDPLEPGAWRWIELVEVPATVVDGRLVTVQGTVRDVTAARRQEDALQHALEREQQAAEQLRAVDEMRATFLAAIGHELRTPLAGLVGAAQTLAAGDGRLDPSQAGALAGVVVRQSERVVTLLDDLLDVERLSRGRMGVDPGPVALLALAQDVAERTEGGPRITVTGDDVVLTVDRTHVERILHNLVRNAARHAASATRVTIEVRHHEEGAVLVVEDDGPGVPAALRDSLFEPFVHGPAARVLPSPGAGIGLALVSKFAELHGGRAWVEEVEGGGARFVVLLGDGLVGGGDAVDGDGTVHLDPVGRTAAG